MSAAKIKKGDKVVVLAGKDKGRTGAVLQVMPKDDKVLVEGIRLREHLLHVLHIGQIPIIEWLIERRCTHEHLVHIAHS